MAQARLAKPRCNPEVIWSMYEWTAKYGAELKQADLSQPNYCMSSGLEAEKFVIGLDNLFSRLLVVSRNFLRSFTKVVGSTRSVAIFKKNTFLMKYGNRLTPKFTNPTMIKLFIDLTLPMLEEIAYYDTFIHRKSLKSICDAIIENHCFDEKTALRFYELNNDNGYGSLQEFIKEHLKHVMMDETFSSFLEGEGEYDSLEIISKAKNDVFYIVQYFRFTTKKLIADQVLSLESLTEYEDIPSNAGIEECSMNFDQSNVTEVQEPAIEVIAQTLPNLKKLTLVKNYPAFKVPLNGDASSFTSKITEAIKTFKEEYAPLYVGKPYETNFVLNMGAKPFVERDDRDTSNSARIPAPEIREVVPSYFKDDKNPNEHTRKYTYAFENCVFNVYAMTNKDEDEPYKSPRTESM